MWIACLSALQTFAEFASAGGGLRCASHRRQGVGDLTIATRCSVLVAQCSVHAAVPEALLEFITPVSTDIAGSLDDLRDIHCFTYRNLGDELLWAASMPSISSSGTSLRSLMVSAC